MNDTSTGRLAGWKEIARCLNTSVRTAQRWEQELGLPVHHTGSSKGFYVFAFEEEFKAWLKGSKGNGVQAREQPGPGAETDFETQASRLPLRKLLAIVAILVVAAGGLFVVIRFRAGHTPKVSLVTFSGRQLLAWSNGKVLWSYDLGQPTRNLRPEDLNRTIHILPSGQVQIRYLSPRRHAFCHSLSLISKVFSRPAVAFTSINLSTPDSSKERMS